MLKISSKLKLKSIKKIYFIAGFLIVYIALVFLASKYNNAPHGDWQSEIHNDKAGYYIYLPATFIHGYYYTDDLEAIRSQLSGFKFSDGKLFTKYPVGVAIMVLPFFLAAHLVALAGAGSADGFSGAYYEMTYYASVFYFLLGAIILFQFLRRRFSLTVTVTTLITIMFATNAFYYALREPLFSHIYSFFLFTLLLRLTENLWSNPDTKKFCLAAIVAGLIFLVRPSNIIFLAILLFLGISSYQDLVQRLRFIFKPLNLLSFIIIFIIVISPQLIYWKFLSGSFLFYSYENEGFIHWNDPKIFEVLFAANNGLLIYSPAYLLAFAGLIVMIFRKEPDRWLIPAITLVFLYMVSSWHSWNYGCSFGQRSFIDYLPLFGIPMASLLNWIFKQFYPVVMTLVMAVILYLMYVNISLSSVYPKCFVGDFWEYRVYWYQYYKAKVFPVYQQRDVHTWFDDFEEEKSGIFSRKRAREFQGAYSGKFVSAINQPTEYSDSFILDLDTLQPAGTLLETEVNLRYYFPGPPGKTVIVCSLEDTTGVFFYKTYPVYEEERIKPETWRDVKARFTMQANPTRGVMKVYAWRMEGSSVYLDDIQVRISSY